MKLTKPRVKNAPFLFFRSFRGLRIDASGSIIA